MKPLQKIVAILSIIGSIITIIGVLKALPISKEIVIIIVTIILLLTSLILYFLQYKLRKTLFVENKNFYLYVFIFLFIIFGIFSFRYVQKIHRKNILKENLAKFESKLQTRTWIAYEPIHFNRLLHKYPQKDTLKIELDTLLKNGFNGIITFSNEKDLNMIPEIVKENRKTTGVIMGISDVRNKQQIDSAIKVSDYVDAYCVGQMLLDSVSQEDVISAIRKIHRKTGKPVSITLRPNGYKLFPNISNEIDWFFPDIHANWYNEDSLEVLLDQTNKLISDIQILQVIYPNKPFLLKMISFPSSEVKNASTKKQYDFFRKIIENSKSTMTFPERVYPSFFSAYDLPWKSPENKYPLGERYLGFFDTLMIAKTVIIDEKKVKVLDALIWNRE